MGYRFLVFALCIVCGSNAIWGQVDPFRSGAPGNTAQRPGVIASVEFVETPITTVFKMISDLTGWSIIMSPQVSAAPPKINIWIKNMTAEQVLDRVCILGGLTYERKGNTVEVTTFDEYAKLRGVEKKVIQLKNVRSKDIAPLLQDFLGRPGGGRVAADSQSQGASSYGQVVSEDTSNSLILLVPQPLLDNLVKLIGMLDVPFERDTVKVIQLKHLEAGILMPKLEEFLTEETRRGIDERQMDIVATAAPAGEAAAETPRAGARWTVQFMVEPKLNTIVLRGLSGDVTKVAELIADLDIPPDILVVSYPLQYTNARDVFDTLQDIVDEDLQTSGGDRDPPRLRASASEQNNQIIVEGSPVDQARLAKIIAEIDKPLPPGSGGIRVYRLENSSAEEVATVIREVINSRYQGDYARQERLDPSQGGQSAIKPYGASPAPNPGMRQTAPPPAGASQGAAEGPAGLPIEGVPAAGDVVPPEVTAAVEINAVIIKASAVEHEEFSAVIKELDKPRDQVMLEVTLVTVRTNDDFNLGVELSGARIGDYDTEAVGFSTFGIGNPRVRDGIIQLTNPPPLGLSAAIFNSGDFSLVLNALRTVGETRISSVPKTLVEDNALAKLTQSDQEPYVTTSQGESSTLTSFGGFVEAGTELTVVPHISKQDWLRLEYEVKLSSFRNRNAQQLAANIPPPKREATSAGTVRIPAEHTVVLGGLVSSRDDRSLDEVPFVSAVPFLGELFRNRFNSSVKETLFIFIRPIVMRDPAFRDLQYLSETDIHEAKISQKDYPVNPLKAYSSALDAERRQDQ